MDPIVQQALSVWGIPSASYGLVAARENSVYCIEHEGTRYALRLHRVGYRSDIELLSELQWMKAVSNGGIQVPSPMPSTSGEVLHTIDGVQVDMLTWLTGTPLIDHFDKLRAIDRRALFNRLGKTMATLHDMSDAWSPPAGFVRGSWDIDGLLGDAPLWDRFWENPALAPDQRDVLLHFRELARAELERLSDHLDFGLIHADLVRQNILVDGPSVQLIDFDDGGFGYRIFDIATALLKLKSDGDYSDLHSALLQGYTSVRPLDTEALDLFLALRAMTYVGWNITRIYETGGQARNTQFIKTALTLAHRYIDP